MINQATIKKSKFKLKPKARDRIFVALMLLIPVIHFCIFWFGVNINSILLAFERLDVNTGETYFTFQNFVDLYSLFQTGELKSALENTLLTFLLLTVVLLPWSFILSYFLYKKILLNGFWRTMLFLPTIIPAIALTTFFTFIIYADGPVGQIYQFLSGSEIPALLVDERYAKWTILIYILWTNFGGQFILFSGGNGKNSKGYYRVWKT